MRDPIESYLEQLGRELTRRVGSTQSKEVVQEASVHLEERVEALVELGASREAAKLEAIFGFGLPWEVAREFSAKPHRLPPQWIPEAVLIISLTSMLVAQGSGLIFALGVMVVVLSPLFCKWLPVVSMTVAMILGDMYVRNTSPNGIDPLRWQSNVINTALMIGGIYLVGAAYRLIRHRRAQVSHV